MKSGQTLFLKSIQEWEQEREKETKSKDQSAGRRKKNPKEGSHTKVREQRSVPKPPRVCMKAYQLKKGDLGYFGLVFTNPI
jgi:hypothetical protein